MKLGFFQRLKNVFGGNAYEAAQQVPHRSRIRFVAPRDARKEISETERRELLRIGRSLEKNSGFFREILLANSIYSVGDGMTPQPRSANAEWNAKARKAWKRLTHRPEITGRFPFWKIQDLACRLIDTDGEFFAIKVTDENGFPKLQIMEAHRVCDFSEPENGILDGIRYSATGKPLGYFFAGDSKERVEVSAQDVIHVFAAGRFTETRGVSPAQHSFNDIRDGRDLDAIEKAADKHINSYGLIVTSTEAVQEEQFTLPEGEAASGGASASGGAASSAERPFGRIGNVGATLMKPGEDAKILESNRPSPAFLGLRAAIDNTAALGNIPLGFLSDPSKLGGAGIRLVVGKAARYFSRRQQELISQFLDKVWLFFIGWAVNAGELEAVEDWWLVEWTTPRKLTVDNGRDAAQIRADIEAGLIPVEDDFGERALNFDDEIAARIATIKSVRERCELAGVDPALVLPIIFKKESEKA